MDNGTCLCSGFGGKVGHQGRKVLRFQCSKVYYVAQLWGDIKNHTREVNKGESLIHFLSHSHRGASVVCMCTCR
jgi:hypothetical protein